MTPAPKPDTGPAVENGRLRYVSVSAVATASEDQDGGCLRKWWFDKVGRLPKPPPTKGQEVGTLVHAEIEHYLRTGEDVLGAIARPGKHFLPEPMHPGLGVELGIGVGKPEIQGGPARLLPDLTVELDTGQTVPFVGYIDALNNTGAWIDTEGTRHAGGPVEIIDWKTSKNVTRYMKAGSALARTIQMVGYARYVMGRFKVDEARVSHVTFATEGPKKAVKTTAVLTRLTVDGRWYSVARTVSDMARAARETDPSKVAPNYTACGAFGGCPYRDACPRDAHTALRDALGASGVTYMGIIDELMGRDQEAALADDKPFGGKIPGKDAMPAGLSVADKRLWLKAVSEFQIAEMEAEQAAQEAAEQKKVSAETVKVSTNAGPLRGPLVKAKDAKQRATYLIPFGQGLVVGEYIGLTKGGRSFSTDDGVLLLADEDGIYSTGVIAPDAPKPGESGPVAQSIPASDVVPANVRAAADKVAPEQAKEPEAPKARKPRGAKKGEAAPEPAPEAVEAATKALADTDPAPSETAARQAVDPAAEEPVDPDERPVLTPKGAAVTKPEYVGFTLLVDCSPVSGNTPFRNLASVVEVVHEGIRETFKCVDLRDSSNDKLNFGKWKAALAAGVRHYHEKHPLTGYVVAEAKGSELVAVAVEALAPMASTVIRGL